MSVVMIGCARCTVANHAWDRYCAACGLPLGTAEPDPGAGLDALGPYEAPDLGDSAVEMVLRDLVRRAGGPAVPAGRGWRLVVPVRPGRTQAVYLGYAGTDPDDRPILSLVSVCGPATERDARALLKLNARTIAGHFAIRVLRGEEYFVVVHNVPAPEAQHLDAGRLVRWIAETADRLEDRLSHGRDLY
jgi:hypothetical protein